MTIEVGGDFLAIGESQSTHVSGAVRPGFGSGLACHQELQPARFQAAAQQAGRIGVQLAVQQGGAQVEPTDTSMPRVARPLAASRPSRPPPMTTARRWAAAASIMRFTSWMSRKVRTPCSSLPGTGRTKGVEPVASSSLSYGVTVPSAARIWRRARSIFVTGRFSSSLIP